MFDSPLTITVTLVMFVGFVLIAIALPPLKVCNDKFQRRLDASKRSNFDDDDQPYRSE
jgi:hypothetical protein